MNDTCHSSTNLFNQRVDFIYDSLNNFDYTLKLVDMPIGIWANKGGWAMGKKIECKDDLDTTMIEHYIPPYRLGG